MLFTTTPILSHKPEHFLSLRSSASPSHRLACKTVCAPYEPAIADTCFHRNNTSHPIAPPAGPSSSVVFLSRKDLKPVFPCIQHQIFRFPLIICIQHCDIREMPGGLPVRKVHQILDKRGKLHICPDPVCQSEKLDPRKFFQLILRTPVRLFRGELVLAVTGKDNRTCSCCPYDPLQGAPHSADAPHQQKQHHNPQNRSPP